MNWLRRRRRRAQLMREATALETEARTLRRTLPSLVASTYGWKFGTLILLAATAVDIARPDLRPIVKALTDGRDEEKAKALEAQAKAKREEALRLI